MILENQSLHLEIARLEAEVAGLKARAEKAERERDLAVVQRDELDKAMSAVARYAASRQSLALASVPIRAVKEVD